jgi:hypothetical protein
MITPPDPRIPALLLAVAAKLGFVVKARDPAFGELGVLADGATERPLYLAGAGEDRVAWTFDAGPRMDPHLMTRETYELLVKGVLREDGAIGHQGRAYQLHFRWSASGMVAEAHAVESMAG